MIEKIPFETEIIPFKDKTFDVQTHASPYDLQIKINELVDAVNELQKQIDKVSCAILDLATPDGENKALESIKAEPADPYAEQRKWIGKLCKVYDDNDFIHYAVLEKIFDNSNYCYGTQIGDYRHCEPVKPDDDVIYKGCDNE